MGRTVVIAEKPSVGSDIARVLGCTARGQGCLMNDRYIVTWAVGHLVTLQEPDELDPRYKHWRAEDLPILPDDIPLKVIASSKDQFAIVKQLINADDTDSLICATDAGREGELIFRYIYQMAGCRKPFRRLWINSMTDEAIQEGFRTIKPGSDYDGLFRSAKCRSESDWLVGMNASRAFTLRYNVTLSVGRVQTPTLAILVNRRREIENFKPEVFYTVTADFGDYTGTCYVEGRANDTHIPTREEAQKVFSDVKGKTAAVRSTETVAKKDPPPQLYDLTSLQRDANTMLGFTADKTLQLAQSLYEKHKALTYPRTDSRYLPPDMVPKVVQTMKLLPPSYQKYVPGALTKNGSIPVTKRTIDAGKVTDHHALIPTAARVDPSRFSPDERQVYDLVTRRMLQAFYPACEYESTKVITDCEGHAFRSSGRVVLKNGFRDVPTLENPPKAKKKNNGEEETTLPPLSPGDTRTVQKVNVKEDATKPPRHLNDATLLAAMEGAGKDSDDEEIQRMMKGSGIGTPATRAAIIERIIKVGYAERKGKNLIATDKGVQLIAIMPQTLASPELTGKWELELDKMARGEDPGDFMSRIRRFTTELVNYARTNTKSVTFAVEHRSGGNGKFPAALVKGAVCPKCGSPLRVSDRAFSCTAASCRFTLWKDCLTRGGGPELTEKVLLPLLERKSLRGSTGVIVLTPSSISFYPTGSDKPTVVKSCEYIHS